jgi:hypothetical protein
VLAGLMCCQDMCIPGTSLPCHHKNHSIKHHPGPSSLRPTP